MPLAACPLITMRNRLTPIAAAVLAPPTYRGGDLTFALEPGLVVTDGGPPREAAVAWSGNRVASQGTATVLGPAGSPAPGARPGSSDAMPPGPRASDALPIR